MRPHSIYFKTIRPTLEVMGRNICSESRSTIGMKVMEKQGSDSKASSSFLVPLMAIRSETMENSLSQDLHHTSQKCSLYIFYYLFAIGYFSNFGNYLFIIQIVHLCIIWGEQVWDMTTSSLFCTFIHKYFSDKSSNLQ